MSEMTSSSPAFQSRLPGPDTRRIGKWGKVAVSWLKIVGLGLGSAATILSHETATLLENGCA